jgi:hypothetical protein
MATTPTWLKDMQAWIQSGGTLQMWDKAAHNPGQNAGPGEGGVDLTAPVGTPVYALATGVQESAQTFASQGFAHPGSVLSQMINVPGYGLEEIYYQHIDLLPSIEKCIGGNCGGTIIQKGQQIGTVGTAGETEVGFNAAGSWGNLYGIPTPGKTWYDSPEPLIAALMGSGGGSLDPSITTAPVSQQTTSNCPWYCALTPFATWGPCGACQTSNPSDPGTNQALNQLNMGVTDLVTPGWWARVGVILLGGILILIGAMKFMK